MLWHGWGVTPCLLNHWREVQACRTTTCQVITAVVLDLCHVTWAGCCGRKKACKMVALAEADVACSTCCTCIRACVLQQGPFHVLKVHRAPATHPRSLDAPQSTRWLAIAACSCVVDGMDNSSHPDRAITAGVPYTALSGCMDPATL
jgi:hypothetical protein